MASLTKGQALIVALQWDCTGELVREDMEPVLAVLCGTAQTGLEGLALLLTSREPPANP